MKKRIALLLAFIICLSAVPALAGWEESGGRYWYSYEDGGWAANRWIRDGAWYYMDGDGWMVTGWKQIGGSWYYFGSGGAMVTGWKEIGGSWYYFDDSGAMATGWRKIGGSWYYFTGSGAMKTGWLQDGGTWYYFNASGAMSVGWEKVGSTWYYFTGSGTMKTGWLQDGGVWYYLDDGGAMTRGWKQMDGTWYYMKDGGAMATGWQKIGGAWYYFTDGGAMKTGWLEADSAWYYLGSGGQMMTGWQVINGGTYYFLESGVMATGEVTIGGKTYKFGGDGKCQEKIKLVVWSFTNELQEMIKKYYAPNHPEIEFEFKVIPTDGNGYVSKLDNQMAMGGAADEAPDIFTLEAAFVKRYTDSDWTADLKTVGFTDEEMSAAFPVMAEIGADTRDGTQKGLSWQSTPGALFYRADLAEKYLGVKTPEEFQELVKDWDSFLATAKKLEEASEGECKIITGPGEIWNVYQYQRDQGWVVDGKLNIDSKMYDYEELIKSLKQDDLSHKGGAWSEVWFSGMRGELQTLCYFLPTWGLHYTLKPHCAEGWDDTLSEEENLAKLGDNKGTYGDWRMVEGPTAYIWGGTWIAANAEKTETADGVKKAAIHDIISFFTLDDEFLVQYAKDTGDFVGSSKAVDAILEEGGRANPFLGGQDHYAIFAQAAALVNGALMTMYDDTLSNMWEDYVTEPYVYEGEDIKTAVKNFKNVVNDKIPTLQTD